MIQLPRVIQGGMGVGVSNWRLAQAGDPASAATAVAQIIGKAVRGGKLCYYLNDGVYSTYSGVIFDHTQYRVRSFKKGPTQICSVFGPTCDALDTISLTEELPDLEMGELVYSENIGAYSAASSTYFNGFPPAKVVHVNQNVNQEVFVTG